MSVKPTMPLTYFQRPAKNNTNITEMQTPDEGAKFWLVTDLRKVARYYVGVLTAVKMKSYIFWDINPCSPLKFNRCFGLIYRLHLQGRRIRFLASCFALVYCLAYSWILDMEATYSSYTSVDLQRTTMHCIPEPKTLHSQVLLGCRFCTMWNDDVATKLILHIASGSTVIINEPLNIRVLNFVCRQTIHVPTNSVWNGFHRAHVEYYKHGYGVGLWCYVGQI
jgi:hypothetical protein